MAKFRTFPAPIQSCPDEVLTMSSRCPTLWAIMRKNVSSRGGSSVFHASRITHHILSFSAAVLLCLSSHANDWPQFRGPDRDGISKETGLLKDWPAGGPPLVWKASGLGKGYSTVSVGGGFIYTIGDRD